MDRAIEPAGSNARARLMQSAKMSLRTFCTAVLRRACKPASTPSTPAAARVAGRRLPALFVLAALSGSPHLCMADSALPRFPTQTPQAAFGKLFVAVQRSGLYADSKFFADAVPRSAPADILAAYERERPVSRPDLSRFVERHFILPTVAVSDTAPQQHLAVGAHIDVLWDHLTRTTPVAPVFSSLLPLPKPYVVPGGRFRELYYWDSYFTMLGLATSGRRDLVESMVADFAYLIDTFGHVPNGTRSYYLTRSQPPFFFAIVGLLSSSDPAAAYARYLPQLRREHAFWMEGESGLRPGQAHRHVVAMADGTLLNRFWDDSDRPRDEAYREDVRVAASNHRRPAQVYRDIRAAAESGWDFSSRWFADGKSLSSINTTSLVTVDLNSLLFGLERAIQMGCERAGDASCAQEFARRARSRQASLDRYLWDAKAGVYRDYRWAEGRWSTAITAATLYPLFVAMASPTQARAVSRIVAARLLERGGIVATPVRSGQQWDSPNGWAPLQWIAISALRRYGNDAMAAGVACRWMTGVQQGYLRTGKLMEKYDVVTPGHGGSGGEYPLQDGFGWTNGVLRQLMTMYPEQATYITAEQCPVASASE